MNIVTETTDIDEMASSAALRSQRRAQSRLRRALRRFTRTEVALERAVASTLALENALLHAIDHPESVDVVVGDVIVPRHELAEYMAMAQYDMRRAARRHRGAASAVSRRRDAVDAHVPAATSSAA